MLLSDYLITYGASLATDGQIAIATVVAGVPTTIKNSRITTGAANQLQSNSVILSLAAGTKLWFVNDNQSANSMDLKAGNVNTGSNVTAYFTIQLISSSS
jgi:hypothetical protein